MSLLNMVMKSTAWVAYRNQTNGPNYWNLADVSISSLKLLKEKCHKEHFLRVR